VILVQEVGRLVRADPLSELEKAVQLSAREKVSLHETGLAMIDGSHAERGGYLPGLDGAA